MKPKYRFTPYVNGVTGLVTIYRQDIDTGFNRMIEDFKKDATLRNCSGRVTVFERRYRTSDNCLMWKRLKCLYFAHGTYHIEDHVPNDPVFDEKFWSITSTEEKII